MTYLFKGKIDKKEMEKITIALYELEGRDPYEARERVREVFKVNECSHILISISRLNELLIN